LSAGTATSGGGQGIVESADAVEGPADVDNASKDYTCCPCMWKGFVVAFSVSPPCTVLVSPLYIEMVAHTSAQKWYSLRTAKLFAFSLPCFVACTAAVPIHPLALRRTVRAYRWG